MNQNDLTKLTESLNKCNIDLNEPLLKKFKEFLKYNSLNEKIDDIINQAQETKISDEEFRGMIEEQKEIMKKLGIRDIDFKKTSKFVEKPEVRQNNLINDTKSKEANLVVKVYNFNEIKNYEVENNKYIFFGPNNEIVKKIRLEDGTIKNINELTPDQQEDLSDDIDSNQFIERQKNLNIKNQDQNIRVQNNRGQNNRGQNSRGPKTKKKDKGKIKLPIKLPKKTKKSTGRKKGNIKSNRHIYHKIPLYARNNYIERPKGLKKKRKSKKKPVKILKDIPEVNNKGTRVPFRGFMDFFKLN